MGTTSVPPLFAVLLLFASTTVAGGQPPPAPLGQPQSFYFDTQRYTEVWVNLAPPPGSGEGVSPVLLNVTVRYEGRPVEGTLDRPPLAVVVRAQANDLYNPSIVRQPILRMIADEVLVWPLDTPVTFYSTGGTHCDECATLANTVEVTIPVYSLWRIAFARTVVGDALGFPFALTADDLSALRGFVTRTFGVTPPVR